MKQTSKCYSRKTLIQDTTSQGRLNRVNSPIKTSIPFNLTMGNFDKPLLEVLDGSQNPPNDQGMRYQNFWYILSDGKGNLLSTSTTKNVFFKTNKLYKTSWGRTIYANTDNKRGWWTQADCPLSNSTRVRWTWPAPRTTIEYYGGIILLHQPKSVGKETYHPLLPTHSAAL